ncbi:MAG: N-acetyltransferase family protein [Gammaproteobacteria bacterium]
MTKLSQFPYHVVLRNGSSSLVREIKPDDKQRLLDVFHRLNGKSIYFRFFSAKHELTEKELKYFTEIDFEHHVAILATIISEGKEEIIGVGRYIEFEDNNSERVAEVAFAVDDEHQSLGVGTILFEQIVTIAQNNGISKLEAAVLLDNKNMLEIFRHSGFNLKTATENGVVHIEFNIVGQEFNKYY